MQGLSQKSTLGTSYTDDQVTAILNDNQNQERWFFERLDYSKNVIEDMTKDIQYETNPAKITHDSNSAIQRTLTLTVRESDAALTESDFLSSIIRPRYQVMSPDGGFLEWILGMFVLSPFEEDIYPGFTRHFITCSDFGQLLVDDTFLSSYGITVGTSYISAITGIVSSYNGAIQIPINIDSTPLTLPATLAWEAGIPRLTAINDLLAAINYLPAWFDETGTLRSSPNPNYKTINPSFIFNTTTGNSIVASPIQSRPDISSIYNQFLVIVEDPRRPAFSVSYINNEESDPISTVNWHPKTKIIRDSRIIDENTAYLRGSTEAQAASRAFGRQVIQTFPWALSQNRDVYQVIYSATDEGLQSSSYVEMKWEHICKAGNMTSHYLERVI